MEQTQERMIHIPIGFICIPIETYDDLNSRLVSLKADFHDELSRTNKLVQAKEIELAKLTNENLELSGEMEELKITLEEKEKVIADIKFSEDLAWRTVSRLQSELEDIRQEGEVNAVPEKATGRV